ncbi:leucine-rich repeat-containing protein 74B-like [Actinia tenebrosa]|uniref:Leucine-rich repeat-containing protein 74B-like n=1 Tax=Actinia tenebrosa TaxID=6105 RepID=A0A6P8H9U4_ACTTE|nr:leucine-rich repeat-containing protein 74B-like [Actinia tenebrosa]
MVPHDANFPLVTENGDFSVVILKGALLSALLDLSGNRVGKPGLTALGEMLEFNVNLKELNLSGCQIQAGSDAEAFVSSLCVNSQLKSLNLSYNEIGDSGAIRLGPVLVNNQSLTFLDISWNNIRSAGAEALCRGLSRNTSLTELDLSWNGLGNFGAECTKQTLIDNKSIRILNLSSNHISITGIKHIAQALHRNRTLQVLKIGKNPFLSSGASMILKSLLANQQSALCELTLEDVVFNEECETHLSALLEQNPTFLCTWDVTIKGGSVISGKQPEPMELLLICIHNQGFRLIDFYKILINDHTRLSLKKEEFVTGIKKRNFPFSDKQLRALFDVLDTKKGGIITFEQFIVLKNYRRQKRR